MTYWFPILQHLTIPVPDTIFVHYPYGESALWAIGDGEEPRGWAAFISRLAAAAEEIGYPVFLRTESTSDKHSWKDTCYVAGPDDLYPHAWALVETCAIGEIPMTIWAVRRMIPTTPVATAFHGQMPVAAERRVFAKQGEVLCHHPYWPAAALADSTVTQDQIRELQHISDQDRTGLERMAAYISRQLPDAFSIDFLRDSDGQWWCIDMAPAESSWHWPECAP